MNGEPRVHCTHTLQFVMEQPELRIRRCVAILSTRPMGVDHHHNKPG